MDDAGTVTRILQDVSSGNREVVDRIVPLLYEELSRIARSQRHRAPRGTTLDTTAVLHEAYLRLVDQTSAVWEDRVHFLAYAAKAMRTVLMDYARQQSRVKRGGRRVRVTLRDDDAVVTHEAETLIALDAALTRLAEEEPRLGRIVECRFFGGMSEKETAVAVGAGSRTVRRDWLKAKAWLWEALG
jgi:RNA polymerase sigma factor (TIGR02999 family)